MFLGDYKFIALLKATKYVNQFWKFHFRIQWKEIPLCI